jgi:predicted PhzF superfamily epimerase YddE/YHI9
MSVTWQMRDHTISWEHTAGTETGPWGRNYGLAFVGNNASIVIDRSSWDLFPEMQNGQYNVAAMPRQTGHDSHEVHVRNWIDCLRTRKDPACPIEIGRLAALYTHMGNIALRTNSKIEWNDTNKNFGNNAAANALLIPEYRKPWALPSM